MNIRPNIEALERRDTPSATLSSRGVLQIDGTAADDTILISHVGSDIVVDNNGTISVFAAADVRRVVVGAGDGDDLVVVDASVTKSCAIYGDLGNDTLQGGSGHDQLYGGIGDDVLLGGAGNDVLDGWDGADVMDGGAGFDSAYHVDFSGVTLIDVEQAFLYW